MRLPVDDIIPDVLAAVRTQGGAVITAPPGSGKTTRVPPALLEAVAGAVWVLQPRRVAARLTAQRIAHERGVRPGDEVGWRVRFDNKSGPKTRLLVVTEGLLTRRLQDDPFLEGIDAIVIDEVHERSLNIDLAMALLKEVRRDVRPDLKLIVMSATVDAEPMAQWLGLPVLNASGRTFPIEVEHIGPPGRGPLADSVARAVRAHVGAGNTLVFLPGKRAIHMTQERLRDLGRPVIPLHGGLPLKDQQRALDGRGPDRVVLTTNLAETSVTVPGVRLVIDSGLVKTMRFDPALGLDRLVTERVSYASATQRAGRAGRTGPGRAVRLWHATDRMVPFTDPAIHREDLADLLLQLFAWGTHPEQLDWFDPPQAAAQAVALQQLHAVGALVDGQLTALGRALVHMPLSPRMGAMLAAGHRLGVLRDAAAGCALLSDRDPFRNGVPHPVAPCDIRARVARLDSAPHLERIRDQLVRTATKALGKAASRPFDADSVAQWALAGFSDRIGQRVTPDRYRLAAGRAELSDRSLIDNAEYIVAVAMRAGQRGEQAEHHIDLAVPIDRAQLPVTEHIEHVFDSRRGAVVERIQTRVGELVLSSHDTTVHAPDILAAHASLKHLALTPADESLLQRVNLLARLVPELEQPPLQPTDLLAPMCRDIQTLAQLRTIRLSTVLPTMVTWQLQQALPNDAPTHYTLPTGTRTRIHYSEHGAFIKCRVQQVFGLATTPRIARGRHPLTLHLLSPAQRPVQITEDLAGFWAGSWASVRKDMRGRYPKHAWPEDPANATPHDRPPRRRS